MSAGADGDCWSHGLHPLPDGGYPREAYTAVFLALAAALALALAFYLRAIDPASESPEAGLAHLTGTAWERA